MRKAQGSNPCSLTQLRGAMDSVSDFESGGCGFGSVRVVAARRRGGGASHPGPGRCAHAQAGGESSTARNAGRLQLRHRPRRALDGAPPARALNGQYRGRVLFIQLRHQWTDVRLESGVAGSSPVELWLVAWWMTARAGRTGNRRSGFDSRIVSCGWTTMVGRVVKRT